MLATVQFRTFCLSICYLKAYIIIYKTIILSVVLYGYETWSLTLKEEHRLRVFENMMLRRILGPRRDEMMRNFIKLHNEELHNLYSSPNIVRVIKSRRTRWAGHVMCMQGMRNAYKTLVEKPEGKRLQEDLAIDRRIILKSILRK
jgi:hypothetical protein